MIFFTLICISYYVHIVKKKYGAAPKIRENVDVNNTKEISV